MWVPLIWLITRPLDLVSERYLATSVNSDFPSNTNLPFLFFSMCSPVCSGTRQTSHLWHNILRIDDILSGGGREEASHTLSCSQQSSWKINPWCVWVGSVHVVVCCYVCVREFNSPSTAMSCWVHSGMFSLSAIVHWFQSRPRVEIALRHLHAR